jgi:hypothetical protein
MYVPLRDAFEIAGVGPTKGYELINAGVLKTIQARDRAPSARRRQERGLAEA